MPRLTRSIAGALMALWLGLVLMTGVAAAIAFPQMKDLAPVLPEYAGHEEHHWSIAAGHVMLPTFRVLDYATLALAVLSVVFAGVCIRACTGRLAITLWLVGLLGASAVGGHHALVRSPQMQDNAHAYWQAMRNKDEDPSVVYSYRVDFALDHQFASYALMAEAALLFLALVGWAATPLLPRQPEPESE